MNKNEDARVKINAIREKIDEAMDDEYFSDMGLIFIIFNKETEDAAIGTSNGGCVVCASELLKKYITEYKIKHSGDES